MANTDYYVETYNSFSGVDIKAVFNQTIIGSLQAISYTVTREKAPIYTMGSPNPRAFNRGKRGIAGTMVFTLFDTDALLTAMQNTLYMADKDEGRVYTSYAAVQDTMLRFSDLDLLTAPKAATVTELTNGPADFDQELREPFYADQIPPFNIVLVANNEYGSTSIKRIFGVEILNEGSGCSIDDIVVEQQYSFVARELTRWIRQRRISTRR